MKRLFLSAVLLLSFFVTEAQTGFRNPVIPGFYPDPSVCRVGDDYYLVNSTFEYFPGVPIFHSKDLVNWKQIGHCLTRKSQLPLEDCGVSSGIYAPTIRYHEGVFYMTTTNLHGVGNFYVTATDPAGEWSEPIRVKQGGIDPDLFFDQGKAYYLTQGPTISMSEIDIKTGEILQGPKPVWGGTGGRYPEAPHLYKKDGYYYLLLAEGGTEFGHKVTIARSRNIWGPYDSNPANPILTHANQNAQHNAIQGTGHGDLIEAHDGSWWMVHLGFRPQSRSHHLLGRETFLTPVRWDSNAWPVVNGDGTTALDMKCETLPLHPVEKPAAKLEFNRSELPLEWTYLRNPDMENYILDKGVLKLKGTAKKLDDVSNPTFVGRRQQHIYFQATVAINGYNTRGNGKAGLTVFMDNESHYDLYVTNDKFIELRCRLGHICYVVKRIPFGKKNLCLRVEGTGSKYSFYYSADDRNYTHLGDLDTRYLSSETTMTFTGVFLGLFAEGEGASVDFGSFEYVSEE